MVIKKKKPVIEIVIIGNEILSDPNRDSNSHYLITALSEAGYRVRYISITGDVIEDIVDVIRVSAARADVVLVTGGLGPTSDDVTVEAAARALGLPLVFDERVFTWIETLFKRRKRHMSDSNKKQAMIPEGAMVLKNEIGTAPGILIERNDTDMFLMPGVPVEMSTLFRKEILPRIHDSFQSSQIDVETLNVTGISESELYDRIKNIPGAEEAVYFYPGSEGIEVMIITAEDSPVDAGSISESIQDTLGDLVFSTKKESLEMVVGKMLIKKGLTIAVAESCTGGLIAHRLTNIPGSSDYMLCGVVAYSNDSKLNILRIDEKLIRAHGVVSPEVAAAMSEGVRRISGADIGISTTGIAGPGGGSSEKPVGLMYGGISWEDGTETKKLQFFEDRFINKSRMSQAMLDTVRTFLKKR